MDMLSATKIEYLVAATREANCTIKFMVSRKEILPNTKMNIIEESRGAQTTNPLKYLKMHAWNLLYKLKELMNKPKLTKPWAIIIITEAIYSS